MKYSESRANAVTEIYSLSDEDLIEKAYYEALKYPESRANAVRQIRHLSKNSRKNAYLEALKYPESRESLDNQLKKYDDKEVTEMLDIIEIIFKNKINDKRNNNTLKYIQDINIINSAA
jgi:hypothetical protein